MISIPPLIYCTDETDSFWCHKKTHQSPVFNYTGDLHSIEIYDKINYATPMKNLYLTIFYASPVY